MKKKSPDTSNTTLYTGHRWPYTRFRQRKDDSTADERTDDDEASRCGRAETGRVERNDSARSVGRWDEPWLDSASIRSSPAALARISAYSVQRTAAEERQDRLTAAMEQRLGKGRQQTRPAREGGGGASRGGWSGGIGGCGCLHGSCYQQPQRVIGQRGMRQRRREALLLHIDEQ